jgi:tRNA G46 methylase TrmB
MMKFSTKISKTFHSENGRKKEIGFARGSHLSRLAAEPGNIHFNYLKMEKGYKSKYPHADKYQRRSSICDGTTRRIDPEK